MTFRKGENLSEPSGQLARSELKDEQKQPGDSFVTLAKQGTTGMTEIGANKTWDSRDLDENGDEIRDEVWK